MNVRFIHTADWQIGKPFAGVVDDHKRALLQDARIQAIHRIGEETRKQGAEFVVVCGDLFDSTTPLNHTVSAACSAIGEIGVPVYVIPGNHDHGGPGSVWHQPFFQREQRQLAPNLHVLLNNDPVELDNAVLFPCPLLRRHEHADPTACIRSIESFDHFGAKARIVLAHGSTVDFSESLPDDEEFGSNAVNVIDVQRLRNDDFDYIALGDWHGTKQISSKAWYSGTPEPDRFAKGSDHSQGQVLVVQASRGQLPKAEAIQTSEMLWKEINFAFSEANNTAQLVSEIEAAISTRANKALLLLHLTGAVAMEESGKRDEVFESLRARLIRLKLDDATVIAPSEAELQGLTTRSEDPLVSRVATRLARAANGDGPDGMAARAALRELYLATASS